MAEEKKEDPKKAPQNTASKEANQSASKEANQPPSWFIRTKAILVQTQKTAKAILKSSFIQKPKTTIKNFGLMSWMKIFTCVAVALLTYTVYKTAPHWKSLWKLPYLSSLESVADQKFSYSSDSKVIRYNNDLLLPQYIVLINKIVVNIHPGKLSTKNPMIAFDLYIRTDTQEASIEIKQREKQLQDHLQRFCEGLNYDQILTVDGKQIWKNRMKRELNLILNTGRVKDIFFKTLVIKP